MDAARHDCHTRPITGRPGSERLQLRQSPGKLVERYVERTHDVAEFPDVVL